MRALGVVRRAHSRKELLGEIRVIWSPAARSTCFRNGRLSIFYRSADARGLAYDRSADTWSTQAGHGRTRRILAPLVVGRLGPRVHAGLVAGPAGAGLHIVLVVVGRCFCIGAHNTVNESVLTEVWWALDPSLAT